MNFRVSQADVHPPRTEGTHCYQQCSIQMAGMQKGWHAARSQCPSVCRGGSTEHNRALALGMSSEYQHLHLSSSSDLSRSIEENSRAQILYTGHVLGNTTSLSELPEGIRPVRAQGHAQLWYVSTELLQHCCSRMQSPCVWSCVTSKQCMLEGGLSLQGLTATRSQEQKMGTSKNLQQPQQRGSKNTSLTELFCCQYKKTAKTMVSEKLRVRHSAFMAVKTYSISPAQSKHHSSLLQLPCTTPQQHQLF